MRKKFFVIDTSVLIDLFYVFEYLRNKYYWDYRSLNRILRIFKVLNKKIGVTIIISDFVVNELKNVRVEPFKSLLNRFIEILDKEKYFNIISIIDDIDNEVIEFA